MLAWHDLAVFSATSWVTGTHQQNSTTFEQEIFQEKKPQLSPCVQSIIEGILVFTDSEEKHLKQDMTQRRNSFYKPPCK